ncbi:MAG TPA: AIR synthase related protein [Solirubrobacteraceae bacterium]|nr:AIR synthase related protein [Solirubrobacteraceae bacterium]
MADPDVHSAYRRAGVDYAVLDAGKRDALSEALATSHWLADAGPDAGAQALDASRGEPAFVLRFAGSTLAFVLETLGTKSVLAREYEKTLFEIGAIARIGDAGHFADVAYDTVAAVLNDLICVGALPLVLNAYFATGSSEWYAHGERAQALLAGWRRACDDARCAWGGGESPALTGLIQREDIELAGSALGFVPPPGEPLLGERLAPGDEIVLVASSGLHANGASLARRVASELPEGLLTPLSDPAAPPGDRRSGEAPGRPFGEAPGSRFGEAPGSRFATQPAGERFGETVLRPSVLYVELVRRLLAEPGLQLSYLSHITGHGLLKLMRPRRELTYRVGTLPPVPPVLAFLAERAGLDAPAAYSTLNMGAGFAVYCRPGQGARVVALAAELGLDALVAGAVEQGPRRVILEPVGVEFASDQLALGPAAEPAG